MTTIHWFRRDLRVTDNTALNAAVDLARTNHSGAPHLANHLAANGSGLRHRITPDTPRSPGPAGDQSVTQSEAPPCDLSGLGGVVPVYIRSEWSGSHRWTGSNRQEFLCGSLKSLDGNLRALGSSLVVRAGDPVCELISLAREVGARAITLNRDPDPHGRKVEAALAKAASREGIEVRAFKDVCVHERDEVLTGGGTVFRVFTPYSRAWLKLDKPEPGGKPDRIVGPTGVRSEGFPTVATWGLDSGGEIIEPGERAARGRLKEFLAGGVARYKADRNTPAGQTTSRLSQDLRFGLLSIREVISRAQGAEKQADAAGRDGIRTFISELIWREFYMQLIWHHPEVLDQEFSLKFRGMKWPGSERDFKRWCDGETGFPIVDAAMRQLNQTGFMHNRARMITAMFLTKDLQVDWRLGEQYFMQKLVDGEIASNNGGWQWSAGTGADAAPYFRIQNPWTQTERYDPDGAYIKKWLPELRDVSAKALCGPPSNGQSLVSGYPAPMVDHSIARAKTLELFAAVRDAAEM